MKGIRRSKRGRSCILYTPHRKKPFVRSISFYQRAIRKKQLHRTLFRGKVNASAVTKNPARSGLDRMICARQREPSRSLGTRQGPTLRASCLPHFLLSSEMPPRPKMRTKYVQNAYKNAYANSLTALHQRLTTFTPQNGRIFPVHARLRAAPLSLGLRRRSLSPRTELASARVRDRLVRLFLRPDSCQFASIRGCHRKRKV
jgi:hypothetical protein